ncbi:SprT family zinc-dependent metalloprotease [Verrucomicrobiaceae bacterium 227]
MDIESAFLMLQDEMKSHGLVARGWVAKLDDARKRFGVCRMGPREISLSRPLIFLNSEEEVRDTVLHEIAHALAWIRYRENCGHDERWKAICVEIGARPERCFDEEVISPELPWALCHGESGEVFSTYSRKPSRNAAQIWIRGRKEETLGKLVYRLNPKLYPEGPLEKFDKLVVGELRDEILAAVESVTRKRGIRVEMPELRGDEKTFDLKLRLTLGTADGRDPELRDFEEQAPMFGLRAEDFHRPFQSAGRRYLLVALKPRNRKYPIIGLDSQGRRFKFERSVLKKLV